MPASRKVKEGGRREGVWAKSKTSGAVSGIVSMVREGEESEANRDASLESSSEQGAVGADTRSDASSEDNFGQKPLFASRSRTSPNDDDSDSTRSSDASQVYWTRILKRSHRMSGIRFSTLIMLQSEDPNIYYHTDTFFADDDSLGMLKQVMLVAKSTEIQSGKFCYFKVPGEKLLDWLPKDFHVDLTKPYRRAKFGAYIHQNLCMRYNILGDYETDLIPWTSKY